MAKNDDELKKAKKGNAAAAKNKKANDKNKKKLMSVNAESPVESKSDKPENTAALAKASTVVSATARGDVFTGSNIDLPEAGGETGGEGYKIIDGDIPSFDLAAENYTMPVEIIGEPAPTAQADDFVTHTGSIAAPSEGITVPSEALRDAETAYDPAEAAYSPVGTVDFKANPPLDYKTTPMVVQKRSRKFKKTPPLDAAERISAVPSDGLTSEQVLGRMERGYDNIVRKKAGKSYARIITSNIFTYLNFLTLGIFAALFITAVNAQQSDFWAQCLFVVIILINTTIGIYQECRSKHTVDKLKLVTAPSAVVVRDGKVQAIPIGDVVLDDILYLEMGKQIATDSIVISGDVSVNESMLTGESVSVKKREGDTLLSGSFVVSGSCYARADRVGDTNYIETLSAHARRYKKPKSELHRSVRILIQVISIIMIPIAVGLIMTNYNVLKDTHTDWMLYYSITQKVSGALIGMIPSGMFLLTSIALFASVLRLSKRRAVVNDLYCIEMLARVDVLCLDKTGTITDGSMRVANVIEFRSGVINVRVGEVIGSMLTALGDNNQTSVALAGKYGYNMKYKPTEKINFSSERKLSAVTFENVGTFILGAPEFVIPEMGSRIRAIVDKHTSAGYRVLCLAQSPSEIKNGKLPGLRRPVALIIIEDHIRDDAPSTIQWFRDNDVAVKVISGDNARTVSEVARRVGVENADKYISLENLSDKEVELAATRYTVFGRVSPDQKAILVKAIKNKGHTVAMTGDGVNDILAMRQADCAVSIASGADAAKNVAHLVLLDNNFTAMPDVVVEGRRVINNVSKTSSLFLMKTLLSIMLSVITLILQVEYFFQTNMLLLLEFFVIGGPSFFLALQPNRNRVEGRYILTVLRNSVPSGIVLVMSAIACYLFCHFSYGMPLDKPPTTEFYTILTVTVTLVGFVMLARLCKPLNFYRGFMFVAMFALCATVTVFGINLFENVLFGFTFEFMMVDGHGLTNWLFVSTVVLLTYFLSSAIDALVSKINLSAEVINLEPADVADVTEEIVIEDEATNRHTE